MKTISTRIGTALVLFRLSHAGFAERTPTSKDNNLAAAFQNLIEALQHAEKGIRQSPSFGTEHAQVGGYRHLLRSFAKGMEAAATMLSTTALTWPAFVNRRYIDARDVNTVAPPYDTYALGGACYYVISQQRRNHLQLRSHR